MAETIVAATLLATSAMQPGGKGRGFMGRYGLGLVLGRAGTFEARMEVIPAAPERLPSRLAVALAGQEAPQFGGFAPELIGVLMVKPTAHARWDQRPIALTIDSGTVCLH